MSLKTDELPISLVFHSNQISLNLLDSIQETELKELIPSLKERILFKRGLNKLQNIIHVSMYSCLFYIYYPY